MSPDHPMTHRERIIKTLCCEPTDRPPLPMWLGLAPWGQTLERWREESGLADLDVARYFGLDPFFLVAPLEYGPYPHVESRVIAETAEWIIAIDWRGITTRNRRDYGSIPEFIRHPVRTHDDWECYKAAHLQPRLEARLASLDTWLATASKSDLPIQVGLFPWGVFGSARDMLGAEELLLGFYTEAALIRDMMDTYVTLWLTLYDQVAQRIPIDHIHLWEDMSGKQGSLISMHMVREFMMPQYDRIAAFARDHGIPVISVDSDGRVDELVPVMMEHGVNAFLPFEVQAGNDIEHFRTLYPHLGILGGLDKNALAGDRQALHAELDRAERMLARGGYVPGFDHLIPPNVPWANFRYAVEQLKALVGL